MSFKGQIILIDPVPPKRQIAHLKAERLKFLIKQIRHRLGIVQVGSLGSSAIKSSLKDFFIIAVETTGYLRATGLADGERFRS